MSLSYTEISLSSKTRMNTKSRKTVTDARLTPVEKMEIFILIINIWLSKGDFGAERHWSHHFVFEHVTKYTRQSQASMKSLFLVCSYRTFRGFEHLKITVGRRPWYRFYATPSTWSTGQILINTFLILQKSKTLTNLRKKNGSRMETEWNGIGNQWLR